MEVKDYIVAIDLGTTNVVTLVGHKNGEDIEVLASSVAPSEGIIRGDIKNMELITKSLKQTVDNVQQELGIVVSEVFVGISGQHIKCTKQFGYVFIENNEGEVKEVDVIRLNKSMHNVSVPLGEAIIHVLPQNYLVDGDAEMKQPVGVVGKKLEAMFNIVTNDKAAVGRTERCLSRVNLKSTQYILNALASAEAILHPDEKEAGVVVVDLGGGTTDVAIFHDNIIRHVAVIPLGGNAINKDIRAEGILERHVEALKIKYGSAVSALAPNKIIAVPGIDNRSPKEIPLSKLSWIIEARLMDIIECVKVEIKRSGSERLLEAGIVLTGGCAQFVDIEKLFERETGYHTRVANRVVGLNTSDDDIINNPIYSTAVGVLLKGVATGNYSSKNRISTAPVKPAFQAAQETFVNNYSEQQDDNKGRSMWGKRAKFEDDNEPENSDEVTDTDEHTKKRGFIGRIKEMITTTFDVIDDEKLD